MYPWLFLWIQIALLYLFALSICFLIRDGIRPTLPTTSTFMKRPDFVTRKPKYLIFFLNLPWPIAPVVISKVG